MPWVVKLGMSGLLNQSPNLELIKSIFKANTNDLANAHMSQVLTARRHVFKACIYMYRRTIYGREMWCIYIEIAQYAR